MASSPGLTRAIVWLVLVAAIVSAPVYLVAEDFEQAHVGTVLASNGVCVVLCVGLLVMLRRGQDEPAARILVLGLLALVGTLAWMNGEDVHVNVVNFLLVTVLASVLLGRRALSFVGLVAAVEMVAIAWRQAVPPPGEELFEARLESIAQFLPTYLVIVVVLWVRNRAPRAE